MSCTLPTAHSLFQIPTQMPSVSLAPTTCYWNEFEYINLTGYEQWEATIRRIESDVVDVKTWLHEYEDTFCLNQGRCKFTLHAEGNGGVYLHPPGHRTKQARHRPHLKHNDTWNT